MYLFALFNSDSVKQNRNTYLTLEHIWQTVQKINNNMHTCIFHKPTPKPIESQESKLSAF